MLTPEHKAARIGRITSSNAAACLGLSPWMSPIDAWHDIRGDDREQDDNTKALERGTQLEDTILDWCGDRLELSWDKPPFVIHPDHDFLGDSADALYQWRNENGGTEIQYVGEAKSVALGSADRWGEEETDQIPDHVLIQCHMHLIHWPEAKRCVVPILIGGYKFEFRNYWVDHDAGLADRLINKLGAWHDRHIRNGEMPEPTALDEAWLRQAHPVAMQPSVIDPMVLAEIEKWSRDYDHSRAEVKALETSKLLAANKLRGLMTDYGAAKIDDVSVTYRNSKDRTDLDTVGVLRSVGWIDCIAAAGKRESLNIRSLLTRAGVPDSILENHTRVIPGPRSLRVTIKRPKG